MFIPYICLLHVWNFTLYQIDSILSGLKNLTYTNLIYLLIVIYLVLFTVTVH